MRLVLAVLIVAVTAASARAQAPGMTPAYPVAPTAAAPLAPMAPMAPVAPYDAKDTDTAVLWSLGGTAGGLALMFLGGAKDNATATTIGALGFVLGPTFGHWYAGEIVTPGLGMRVGGVVLGYAGVVSAFGCYECKNDNSELTAGLLIGGAALYVIGGLYDIGTAPRAAREWNERHTLTLVPTAMAATGGTAPGFAVAGTF